MSFMRQMVRGFVWKCRMINGAEFEWWTPMADTTRAEARQALFSVANSLCNDKPAGQACCDDDCGQCAYFTRERNKSQLGINESDMEALWKTKGKR